MRKLIIYSCLLRALAYYCVQASNETETSTNPPDEITDDYSDKNESFVNCEKFPLDPDEYTIYPNRTAYVSIYNKSYEEQFYYLEGETLFVCVPHEGELDRSDPTHTLNSDALHYLTSVGIGVSMVCLFIHLIVFAVVPDMQNLPGWNMASLCASLFFTYMMMVIAGSDAVHQNRSACIAAAGTMQFFFISSFLWMFIIAFGVFRSIVQATTKLRAASRGFKAKRYMYNSLVAWGISLTFTSSAMIADNIDSLPEWFRPQFEMNCWFYPKESLLIFFICPVTALICINFTLFGISAYKIFANKMRSNKDSHSSTLVQSNLLYLRLGIIMGVTWISAAFVNVVNALWLWCVFAVFNTFQGLFIFLAFTCTDKMRKHLREKFLPKRSPKISLSPTFQSYSNCTTSTKDEVANSSDRNAVAETEV